MKLAGKGLSLLILLGLLGVFANGCGPALPCNTSLITLDETRLDAETFEQEAAETGQRVDDLSGSLVKKQSEIEGIKDDPATLAKKLHELKKGSGRE
jgi:hypothetical protein